MYAMGDMYCLLDRDKIVAKWVSNCMVVVDSKSLFFFLLAEEENMDYDLLAGFGSLIIFKHGVSYLHFTRLKIAKMNWKPETEDFF